MAKSMFVVDVDDELGGSLRVFITVRSGRYQRENHPYVTEFVHTDPQWRSYLALARPLAWISLQLGKAMDLCMSLRYRHHVVVLQSIFAFEYCRVLSSGQGTSGSPVHWYEGQS